MMYFKNKKEVPSKFGGTMWYLFFNDGEKSYRTCIDSTFRNFKRWERLVNNASAGDIVLNLRVKGKGLIDADSFPKYGGNIYDEARR